MIETKIVPIRGTTREATKKISRLTARIKNTTNVNRQVSIWLLRWVDKNFRTQGGLVQVGGWPALKTGGRYKKNPRGRKVGSGRKRRYDPYAKVLQDTGRLRKSVQPFHSRTTAGVGSDLYYAPFHDLGVPSRNLPQRRILPNSTDKDVEQGVLKIYETYVARSVR